MSGLALTLLFGLLLGMKHATEPDHVVAVSTIASRTSKLSLSSLAGVFWGVGHTLTLLVVGMIVISLKQHIPETVATWMEMAVGVMIIVLAVASFRATRAMGEQKPLHIHHLHMKSMLIGVVHGMAGSAGMVLLTLTTVETPWQAFAFIVIFGLGTVIGMMIFTTLLGLPFLFARPKQTLYRALVQVVSVISLVYGVYYLYEVGREGGLF
ncbi:urease accessory protein UreH [Caldibacillus thermoamylovorans]